MSGDLLGSVGDEVSPVRAIVTCRRMEASDPKEAAMPRSIDRDEVERMVREERAQLVEVLPAAEFEEDHLPGAINLPLRKLEQGARGALDPRRPVIVYCWDFA